MNPDGGTEGLIEATLPKGLFRVRLESGAVIRAALSSQARRVTVKLIPGDRVLVSLHPHDPTRGRITQRL
ncbi:MAG: translation initiation factor IF-1 [Myxococcota bacterium]